MSLLMWAGEGTRADTFGSKVQGVFGLMIGFVVMIVPDTTNLG
jgi:hypothetical protein